ncbi:transposase [Sphingobium sp. CCH11-B1]|uniref:transposase n=1 Tax=Sphingobium sp. CCH11-B1 TaxID=1768781 RepID=UPI0009E7740F|nr:transposase [Sphingobium sp. CCH11-B1]
MWRGRFAEDQISGVLREHEAGVKTAELCRKHSIHPISSERYRSWVIGNLQRHANAFGLSLQQLPPKPEIAAS